MVDRYYFRGEMGYETHFRVYLKSNKYLGKITDKSFQIPRISLINIVRMYDAANHDYAYALFICGGTKEKLIGSRECDQNGEICLFLLNIPLELYW